MSPSSSASETETPMKPHPPGKFEFAFKHTKGEPWWLTDGYGYSREVKAWTWLYYRIGRKRRTDRFNRRLQNGLR